MDSDYFGIRVVSVLVRDRWQWQVTLPVGATVMSNECFDSAKEALERGKYWIGAESIMASLNLCLSELCADGKLDKQEYCDLMASVAQMAGDAGRSGA